VISPAAVAYAGNGQNLTGWDVYLANTGTSGGPQGQAASTGDNTAGQRLYTVATMDSLGTAPGNWETYAQPPAPPVAAPPQALVAQTTTPAR
jgi:hypothetical protein